MAKRKILIVDDDPSIRDVLKSTLDKAGFEVIEATNGVEALTIYKNFSPELIVLDILMPEMDGTDVCREIRRHSNVPIIFLTSLDEEADRIIGLELGGDDYVVKPFSPRELLARVKAVLRRLQPLSQDVVIKEHVKKVHGSLSLDVTSFEVSWKDLKIPLTAMEFHLLEALFDHPNKVYSRDELMEKAYEDNTVVTDRTIDSHIRRIRKKFFEKTKDPSADPIETVHGFGYRLVSKKSV